MGRSVASKTPTLGCVKALWPINQLVDSVSHFTLQGWEGRRCYGAVLGLSLPPWFSPQSQWLWFAGVEAMV